MFKNFWCDVAWCATKSGCEGLFADDFRQAKVGEFDAEILVDEENVFGLDIAVDDVALMLKRTSQCV